MSQETWKGSSHTIFQKVTAHPFFLDADEIYCYVDYRNEVGTAKIIGQAWELGKKVAVPKVTGDVMEFYYIQSFEELKSGYANIMEPVTEEIALGENVLVIMPGAVFDISKNRIGYGGGFYDKYLEKYSNYRRMAIAFELQMVESIPTDSYDICPEVIITEENIYV